MSGCGFKGLYVLDYFMARSGDFLKSFDSDVTRQPTETSNARQATSVCPKMLNYCFKYSVVKHLNQSDKGL